MKLYKAARVVWYETTAEAMAAKDLLGKGDIAVVQETGEVRIGYGNRVTGETPSTATGKKFSDLPAVNSNATVSRKPFTTYAQNATGTITAANLVKKRITSTSAAAVTLTLPTATSLGTALTAAKGTIFEFEVDNTAGANTVTVAVGTAITVATPAITGGNTLTVAAGTVGFFRIFFITATTALLFRLA